MTSLLLYGKLLYFFQTSTLTLSCHDALTGEVHVGRTRLEGRSGVYASPVGAAYRVYLVGKELYLRGHTRLYCIVEGASKKQIF